MKSLSYPQARLLVLVLSVLILAACSARTGDSPDVVIIEPGEVEVPVELGPRKPLLLIGFDGFKPDYLEQTATPNLDAFIAEGVRAEALIPVFPSKTMVNLYSIVTGLYPENSGIISNSMYDAELDAEFKMFSNALSDERWFHGEPIWVSAENQGVRTGTVFWVGSEAPIKGVRPTHWLPYNSRMTHKERIDKAMEWLTLTDDRRPEFVTLYFSRPDNTGHSHGTDSGQIRETIRLMDEAMGYLFERLRDAELYDDMNIVFVSDHGMTNTTTEHLIMLDEIMNLGDVRMIEWTPVAMMQPREGRLEAVYSQLKAAEENYKVYRKEDLPERYRIKNSPRVPDIVMVADLPYTITSTSFLAQNGIFAGNHGYDPEEPDMHGFFLARGPGFKKGMNAGALHLVDLYEMMAHLLQLQPAPNDGSLEAISSILAPQ